MSNKEFINNLSATYADVRKLDVKKINLKGKNILEYIKESVPVIKHSQDTRETITENDFWGQYIETTADGTIIVHDDWVTNPNSYSALNTTITSITKVEDNKAYVDDALYGNIQTERIKDGNYMFKGCSNLTTFTSDLSCLTNGYSMFNKCTNLTTFSSDLPSLTNGYSMFDSCSKLESFTSNLSNLTDSKWMFANCSQLNSFTSDLPRLTEGRDMFKTCTNLTAFTSDLPSLKNGYQMFSGCSQLNSFSSDLSSLKNGYFMFNNCSQLNSFTSDLPSMTYGYQMFSGCSNLTTFTSDLSSLTDSRNMFQSCSNLTTFSSDMPSLIDGDYMFFSCSKLTTFTSDLSSLICGSSMFDRCSLNAQSVMFIADTINDITSEKQLYTDGVIPYVTVSDGVYSAPKGFMSDGNYAYTYNNPQSYTRTLSASFVGQLTLGINVTNDSSTIQQQLEDFAQEATFESWADLKQYFRNKGWKPVFQYGGTATRITYGLRGGEQIIPCQIFAKLVQAEDNDSAKYCSEDASTFYNIEWGHDVTDTTGYTQFDSLEDAMASWNVFPKENIIITEE